MSARLGKKKGGGSGANDGGGNDSEVVDGRTFLKKHNSTPRHQRVMNKYNDTLNDCDARLKQLGKNPNAGALIEEVKQQKAKILHQQEMELCNVALDDKNISEQQRKKLEEYLKELRAELEDGDSRA